MVMMSDPVRRETDLWKTKGNTRHYVGSERGLGRNQWRTLNHNLQYDLEVLLKLLQDSWQSTIIPGTMVTIDECRINAQQDSAMKSKKLSYNSGKPSKWAWEVISLHDTTTQFMYSIIPSKKHKPFQSAILLSEQLKSTNRKHHITWDSRFTSIDQVDKLRELGFYFTLHSRSNDKPTHLWKQLSHGLRDNNSAFAKRKKDNVISVVYNKNSKLYILSNFFTVAEARESGKTSYKNRELILNQYDDTKQAADQFNLMVAKFHTNHTHQRFEMNILIGLLEWGIQNAYICYCNNTTVELSHNDFIRSLSSAILLEEND